MPDTPTPPAEPTPPPGGTPRRRRRAGQSQLNQTQARELSKAEQVALAARRADYKTRLAARDIAETFVNQLLLDVTACRQTSASAMQDTHGREDATATEASTRRKLLRALREIQAAAKQKYGATQPIRLQDFGVGRDIDGNRVTLEQYSQGLLDLLATEELPGISPQKLSDLAAKRIAWTATQSNQSDMQTSATTTRGDRDREVRSITTRRLTIQMAAEAEWPHHEPAHAGIRRAFQLPPRRPFTVRFRSAA
jgi:hypothetical protein